MPSRSPWPTRSATESSRVSVSPEKSAAANSDACCATCPATCVMTSAPGPSSSRARRGPSTVRGLPSPPRGSFSSSCASRGRSIRRYSSTGGVLILASGAALCLVAYRLMMLIGRLPDERRILS